MNENSNETYSEEKNKCYFLVNSSDEDDDHDHHTNNFF